MYDVVIVGSGPAGLCAAVYAKRAMLNMVVIEKNGYSGGQIINTSEVDNYLGLQGVSGFDMAMNFRAHAEHFGVLFVDGEIVNVTDINDSFELEMSDGKKIMTKTVIVATGAGYSKLNVPGEKEFVGKGVSYCATCDGAFYKGKVVAVVGGGDVALGDALYLSKIASKVYLIHRRDELRGAKTLQERIFATENIEFVPDTVVTSINGNDGGMVGSISIKNVKDDKEVLLDINGIFVAVGMKPETDFVKELVETDDRGYIVAGEDGITSRAGIFVAGDARTKKLRQVITAVADGACAVDSAEKYLCR